LQYVLKISLEWMAKVFQK